MKENKDEELERNYVFFIRTGAQEKDVERLEVPESELDHDQIGILVARLHSFYLGF